MWGGCFRRLVIHSARFHEFIRKSTPPQKERRNKVRSRSLQLIRSTAAFFTEGELFRSFQFVQKFSKLRNHPNMLLECWWIPPFSSTCEWISSTVIASCVTVHTFLGLISRHTFFEIKPRQLQQADPNFRAYWARRLLVSQPISNLSATRIAVVSISLAMTRMNAFSVPFIAQNYNKYIIRQVVVFGLSNQNNNNK